MPLTLDQFNHLADRCAPGIDHRTLRPFAQVESGFDPWSIHDNTDGRSVHPDTEAQAIAIARDLMRRGHVIDTGLMQISNRNFDWLGLNVETAFDPCQSIRAAAQHLTEASRYNTGSPTRGFANGYVTRIVNATFHIADAHDAHPFADAGGRPPTSDTNTGTRPQPEAQGATVKEASIAPATASSVPSWDLFGRAKGGPQ